MIDKKRLTVWMVSCGYTQKTLAEAIRKSKNTVNSYVNNRSSCDLETANEICHVLGIEDHAEKARIFLTNIS